MNLSEHSIYNKKICTLARCNPLCHKEFHDFLFQLGDKVGNVTFYEEENSSIYINKRAYFTYGIINYYVGVSEIDGGYFSSNRSLQSQDFGDKPNSNLC